MTVNEADVKNVAKNLTVSRAYRDGEARSRKSRPPPSRFTPQDAELSISVLVMGAA